MNDMMMRRYSRRGFSGIWTIVIIAALIILVSVGIYLSVHRAAKVSATLEETARAQQAERKPAMGKIIAAYDQEYDSADYCADGEIDTLRCEDTCPQGTDELQPKDVFVDCMRPRHCCRYAPEESPSFEEEPR